MRLLLVVFAVIAIPIVVALLLNARAGPRRQAQPIDADHESPPPGPDITERMADPPPGSQPYREERGKP